jgi:5'-3' exonuclease
VDPLLVVDAPYLLYRSFFALPDSIHGAEDRPVNALLGSVNVMLRVIDATVPRAVVMCFGPDAAPYRTELYPAYHGDRPPPPDDLAWQFAQAPDLYAAFGWSSVSDSSVEADDLLGSYAQTERDAGGRTLILTGDRDMYQCATDDTHVLFLKSGVQLFETVDPDEVRKRYGIGPELVPDFIALRGDPSDGLPGAPGIGAKTAADLLQRHGSLEDAISKSIHERPRVTAALTGHADELRAFREIATLRILPVERPEDQATDLAAGAEKASELGMGALAKRLGAGGG